MGVSFKFRLKEMPPPEALGLGKRDHLAIVGAGGKTSLLLVLAERLRNKKVILSTTTRINQDEARRAGKPIITLREPDWKNRLRDCLKRDNQAVLVGEALDSGKFKGISPSLADEIFLDRKIDYLLLEADGAAGRSIKAPSEKEPVIPSSVTKVVAVMGLDAVNQPFNRERVFREQEFQDITGARPGERLAPGILFRLFIDPKGLFKGTPPGAGKIAFLNRLDLISDQSQAFMLADLIYADKAGHPDRVIIGSIKENEFYCRY